MVGDRPARGPRLVLRVGRAARRPRLLGKPVIVGGGVGARRAATRRRPRRAPAMGGAPGAPAVPTGDRGAAAAWRPIAAEQGGVRDLRGHDAAGRGHLDRRGVPRRARHAARSPGRRARWPCGCARRVREQVGLPITVGIARTKFLAKVASRVAKPDGLLEVPPERELAWLHRLPVELLWGVGAGHVGEAARPRDRDGRPGRRHRGGGARLAGRPRGGPPAARLAHNRRSAARRARSAGGARWARSARSAAACARSRSSTRRSWRSATACGAGCGGRAALPHRHAAPRFDRLLARDALAHAAGRTGETQTILVDAAPCWRRRCR